jgi:hypothetical protein
MSDCGRTQSNHVIHDPGRSAVAGVKKIMAFVAVAIALLMLQPVPGPGSPAGGRPSDDRRQQTPAVAKQAPPAQPAPQTSSDDLFSIDHIRKELEQQPTLTFTMPDPNAPRYHVDIQGSRFELLDLQKRLAAALPKSSVPGPLGGSDYYEMMRLNTPSQYFGSAPFTNGDLLKMSALTGAYGLAGLLVKKGLEARRSAAQAQEHDQVQQELEAIAAHNARVAAGLADPDPPTVKKKADEKKPAKKKKKDDEKKIDGGR